MSQDNNSCAICLEPLQTSEIGAVHPCGHIFHTECWSRWALSRGGSRHPKCALCNHRSSTFCKIYLDLEAMIHDDDDDDMSLSSLESNSGAEETTDETERSDADSGDNTTSPSTNNNNCDETAAVAENKDYGENSSVASDGVQVLSNPPHAGTSSSGKTKNKRKRESEGSLDEEASSRYRRMAKRLKQKCRTLQSKLEEQHQNHETVAKKLEETTAMVTLRNEEFEAVLEENVLYERQIEELSLEETILQRQLDSALTQNRLADKARAALQMELSELKSSHERDIRKARATSMTEVKHLLEQHPKLTKENHALKKALMESKEMIAKLQSRQTIPVATKNTGSSSKKGAAQLLQEMGRQPTKLTTRKQATTQPQPSRPQNRREGFDEEVRQCLKKSLMSVQKISKAINAKKSSTLGVSPIDMLGASSAKTMSNRASKKVLVKPSKARKGPIQTKLQNLPRSRTL